MQAPASTINFTSDPLAPQGRLIPPILVIIGSMAEVAEHIEWLGGKPPGGVTLYNCKKGHPAGWLFKILGTTAESSCQGACRAHSNSHS